jgi:hypothetical protein
MFHWSADGLSDSSLLLRLLRLLMLLMLLMLLRLLNRLSLSTWWQPSPTAVHNNQATEALTMWLRAKKN